MIFGGAPRVDATPAQIATLQLHLEEADETERRALGFDGKSVLAGADAWRVLTDMANAEDDLAERLGKDPGAKLARSASHVLSNLALKCSKCAAKAKEDDR